VDLVSQAIVQGKTRVIDLDLRAYFDSVRHHILLEKMAKRIDDPDVMRLLKLILKATGDKGVPQGGVISPLMSNVYLNEVDRMLEKAKAVTRQGQRTSVEYARWADDLVILVDGHPQHDWLLTAVNKRLRKELAKLQVEINEEKSRTVDLTKGESFGYLGFDFRRVRSRYGKWRPLKTPKVKKRTELLGRLREVFRSLRSQPVQRVIEKVNPMVRGWVNYFGHGNASRCFSYVRDWVEKKMRRHLARNSKRHGYGWKRWSRHWLYKVLGLFSAYRLDYLRPRQAALPAGAVS
jgi:RNA-directed DNA polymerase